MPYYITTAIDYVNSKPHLGTAYEKMAADVIARYQRGRGQEVRFLMGNDEHSQKVAQAAREQGLAPLDYCNRMEQVFRAVWDALDVRPDDFIRTTEARHRRAVTAMLERINKSGDLYQGHYVGWYCVGCEAFKRADDLVEERCPEHPETKLEWIEEQNWFFRLSRFQEPLLAHYEAHPDFIRPPHRRNELLGLLKRGLEDISVSRSSTNWGVRCPFDDKAVAYVWFDALINYISALNWPEEGELYDKFWPADLHLVGKDITRFHAVIWPAMLLSAGLPLPRTIFGHGFVNLDSGRMSKSAGRTADPLALADCFGSDALRYYICREAPFGQDLHYTRERLEARYTGELCNGIGNLASRLEAMLVKYREGLVDAPPRPSSLLKRCREKAALYQECMQALDLRGGAEAAMSIVAEANLHVDQTAPFRLARDPNRALELRQVLAELTHALLLAAALLQPFMPRKMGELLERLLGVPPDLGSLQTRALELRVPAGHRVGRGAALFPRLEP